MPLANRISTEIETAPPSGESNVIENDLASHAERSPPLEKCIAIHQIRKVTKRHHRHRHARHRGHQVIFHRRLPTPAAGKNKTVQACSKENAHEQHIKKSRMKNMAKGKTEIIKVILFAVFICVPYRKMRSRKTSEFFEFFWLMCALLQRKQLSSVKFSQLKIFTIQLREGKFLPGGKFAKNQFQIRY